MRLARPKSSRLFHPSTQTLTVPTTSTRSPTRTIPPRRRRTGIHRQPVKMVEPTRLRPLPVAILDALHKGLLKPSPELPRSRPPRRNPTSAARIYPRKFHLAHPEYAHASPDPCRTTGLPRTAPSGLQQPGWSETGGALPRHPLQETSGQLRRERRTPDQGRTRRLQIIRQTRDRRPPPAQSRISSTSEIHREHPRPIPIDPQVPKPSNPPPARALPDPAPGHNSPGSSESGPSSCHSSAYPFSSTSAYRRSHSRAPRRQHAALGNVDPVERLDRVKRDPIDRDHPPLPVGPPMSVESPPVLDCSERSQSFATTFSNLAVPLAVLSIATLARAHMAPERIRRFLEMSQPKLEQQETSPPRGPSPVFSRTLGRAFAS